MLVPRNHRQPSGRESAARHDRHGAACIYDECRVRRNEGHRREPGRSRFPSRCLLPFASGFGSGTGAASQQARKKQPWPKRLKLAVSSIRHGLEEGAGSAAGPLALRDRLSPPFGPSLRSRKRRTDVPVQAPADGRLTRRPAALPELDAQLAEGDTIPLTADRSLRVLGVRDEDADQPPALVVEDHPDRPLAPPADVS